MKMKNLDVENKNKYDTSQIMTKSDYLILFFRFLLRIINIFSNEHHPLLSADNEKH